VSPRESQRPPEFLVDRSLGSVIVPAALRARGFTVHTLQTVYGEEVARELDDEVWLGEAGNRDWIVLAKDERIRRRPNELAAIRSSRVKAFYLTAGGLKGDVQAAILLKHINRIIQRSRQPGPMIWAVTKFGLRRVL
jgi:PIN like domain